MKMLIESIKVDFKLQLREFTVVFFSIFFPVLMILMFGGIYGNEPTPFFGGFGAVDVLVPSYIGVIIAVNGLMSLPLTLVEYRDRKILKRLMATPMKPIYVIFSQLIVNFVLTLIGFILLIFFGKIIFDLHFFGNIFKFLFSFVVSILSIFSIGFLIASLVPNIHSATAIANIIYFPMLFLSGATIPVESMPKFILNIAKILPLTYVVDLFKRTWLNSDITWLKTSLGFGTDITILIFIIFISFTISIFNFKWYYE